MIIPNKVTPGHAFRSVCLRQKSREALRQPPLNCCATIAVMLSRTAPRTRNSTRMRILVASLLLVMTTRPGWADFGAAESALRLGDYGTAYETCKADAEKGDAECENLIGVLFRQGVGVAGNPGEAVRFFRR